MSKEIAKDEKKEVGTPNYASYYQDETSTVDSSDVAISSLILLQGQSEYVTDYNLPAGAIADREAKEVVAELGKGIEVIPVGFNKTWMVTSEGDSGQYLTMLPFVPGKPYPNQGEWDGIPVNFFACIHAYVLIPNLGTIPYKVMFKSTSLKAGKQLLTESIVKNQMAKKPPFAYTMYIGSERRKGKKASYFAFNAKRGREVPTTEYAQLDKWYHIVSKMVSEENKVLHKNESERKEAAKRHAGDI